MEARTVLSGTGREVIVLGATRDWTRDIVREVESGDVYDVAPEDLTYTHGCSVQIPHDMPVHCHCEPTNKTARSVFASWNEHRKLRALLRSVELFDGTRTCAAAWKQAMSECAPIHE